MDDRELQHVCVSIQLKTVALLFIFKLGLVCFMFVSINIVQECSDKKHFVLTKMTEPTQQTNI